MAYTYAPINHSLIDMDLKIPEEKKKPVPKKPVLKDRPVRKPNAVPPKTRTIKMANGGVAIKKRPEDMAERLERTIYKYEGTIPKPKHFDDKSIVDQEEWNNMNSLERNKPIIVKRPKKFDNNDPSTYPMNQKKTMNDWELILQSAKDDPTDENSKDTRRMINRLYKDPKTRKDLGNDELRLINKHPEQIRSYVQEVTEALLPKEPEKIEPQPVNNFDLMRDVVIPGAEEQRQKEMKKLDDQFGPGGLVDIMKDRI